MNFTQLIGALGLGYFIFMWPELPFIFIGYYAIAIVCCIGLILNTKLPVKRKRGIKYETCINPKIKIIK